MGTTLPRISVVTPSFNQGRFLRQTIESVLNQDYPNLEYFVVDGGSTDNSVAIVQDYQDRIDWWVSEKDEGQTHAISKGFARATGELVGWLNSDDVYFPKALRKIGEAYAQSPGASIYAGGVAIGKMGDGPIARCSIPVSPPQVLSRHGYIGFGQMATFYDSRAVRQVGGLDIQLYIRMDMDLMHRLLRHNPKTVVVDDMVGFFRRHESMKCVVAVDRYRQEYSEFRRSLKTTPTHLTILGVLYKLNRLATGGYLKSLLATLRYRGIHMSDVWHRTGRSPR